MPNVAATHIGQLSTYLGSRYSEHTKASFGRSAAHFLRSVGVKPAYDRRDLLGFIDHLIKAGYGSASIHTMLAGVRALFRAMELPWPLDKGDTHLGLQTTEDAGAIYDPGEIETLIRNVPKLGYPDLQIVALSTMYGFRNTELAMILSAGCDGKLLTVQTTKNGRKRVLPIPSVLSKILHFGVYPIGSAGLHHHFDTIMNRCLRAPRTGEGWHAIRRGLVSGMSANGVDSYTIHKYMGWRVPETAFGYDRRTPLEVCTMVYEKHPFLPVWAGL
jgi:hypothetical protein